MGSDTCKLRESECPVRIDIGVSWKEIEEATEMANENYVLVNGLAKEHGYDRSAFRKFLMRNGYIPKKLRTVESGGQWNLVITREEAKEIIAKRGSEFIQTDNTR